MKGLNQNSQGPLAFFGLSAGRVVAVKYTYPGGPAGSQLVARTVSRPAVELVVFSARGFGGVLRPG